MRDDLIATMRLIGRSKSMAICHEAADTIERLTRELDAARKDADRYRLLKRFVWRTSDLDPPHWEIPAFCGIGETVDEAIDNYISATTDGRKT